MSYPLLYTNKSKLFCTKNILNVIISLIINIVAILNNELHSFTHVKYHLINMGLFEIPVNLSAYVISFLY
jgi:hypothetical protein